MKMYKVFYMIKKNGHAYLEHMIVEACNQKEAKVLVKKVVRENTNRCAFHVTCEEPVKNKYGLEWNGMTFTKYNELSNRLW